LTLASPGDGDPLAIDALMLLEPGDAPPLRRTVLARAPSGHFIVRATAQAPLQMEPGRIVSEFERIYARYHDYFGFAPERPIGIHVIEGARWPEPGASAFQNDDGVFFRAEAMATEQGNFCHEMTHMFYLGHLPRWMDEPSVHALTTMVWMPALYPNETDPGTRARSERSRGAGEAFWANLTEQYDSVEPVLDALIVRYGPDVYRRFFHACVEAGKAEEIDFTPNRHLTRAEVVHLMSRAAGEDVESVFHRWRGFAEAAP
jgi:hypothetical protein